MIRVHVICEGQTEEEFVRHLLSHQLIANNVAPFKIQLTIQLVGLP